MPEPKAEPGGAQLRPRPQPREHHLDTQGLVWAYRFGESIECARQVTGHDEPTLSEASSEPDPRAATGWLHFSLSDRRTRPWLERHASLPGAVLTALVEPEPEVAVQSFTEGMLIVLFDVAEQEFKLDPESFGALRLNLDERRVPWSVWSSWAGCANAA